MFVRTLILLIITHIFFHSFWHWLTTQPFTHSAYTKFTLIIWTNWPQRRSRLDCTSLDSQESKISSGRQQRLWSDCADLQADLSLHWVNMSEGRFSHFATCTQTALLQISLQAFRGLHRYSVLSGSLLFSQTICATCTTISQSDWDSESPWPLQYIIFNLNIGTM